MIDACGGSGKEMMGIWEAMGVGGKSRARVYT